jgi:TPR repeat protein
VSTKLAAFSAADANQLFAEGQKYLYGNGVERDCGRALEDLRIAARLNAEAASLLGTMYASGHCVGQNLAPAYRWYARALHRDPGNARYKTDLEVLWKQMTPQDKQAALRIAP